MMADVPVQETFEQRIAAHDAYLIIKEEKANDGSFFVRCLNSRCYRVRDKCEVGTGKDGIYIFFEIPEDVYKNNDDKSYGRWSCPTTN